MLRRTPIAEIPDFGVDEDLVVNIQPAEPVAPAAKAAVHPIPRDWQGDACRQFDEEMEQRMGGPYDRAQMVFRKLMGAEERIEDLQRDGRALTDAERDELQELTSWVADTKLWLHENVYLNPLIKEKMFPAIQARTIKFSPDIVAFLDEMKARALQGVTQAAASKAAPPASTNLARHEGVLLEHGAAHYNFDKTESMSYYAKLQVGQDARYVWGVDLERGLQALAPEIGTPIVLQCLGKNDVLVPVKQFDAEGNFTGTKEETVNRNTWSVAEAAQPELAKVAEAGGELAGQAMVVGVDLDATELSLTRLQVQGLDAAPGAEPDARTKEEKRKRLFDETFWEDCKSIYLAPAEKGGLRTDIQITETTVKFILGKLGQIDLDTRDNTIGVRGRLDPVQAAMAMIELAQKAGWKTLSFHGDKRFMDVAIPLAEKAGFTVVDQATMAEMLRVRSDEKKAEKGDEIPFDQGPTP
ncbi:TPA: hypothetical protein VDU30_002183 [Pseudomonas aeruginosa]|nr:hypothetical protein [Pseudomonas aeruginosa]HEP8642600.1 hypothetical protein [Pseudomonas aeruginosa]